MTEATKLVDRLITLALQQGRRDRDADDGEHKSYEQYVQAQLATQKAQHALLTYIEYLEEGYQSILLRGSDEECN